MDLTTFLICLVCDFEYNILTMFRLLNQTKTMFRIGYYYSIKSLSNWRILKYYVNSKLVVFGLVFQKDFLILIKFGTLSNWRILKSYINCKYCVVWFGILKRFFDFYKIKTLSNWIILKSYANHKSYSLFGLVFSKGFWIFIKLGLYRIEKF